MHWADTKTKQVFQTEPQELGECPFCQQTSDAILKIYNTNTRHYGSFSLGSGKLYATFTCRNCTQEDRLAPEIEVPFIAQFRINAEFDSIQKQHDHNPNKAKKRLARLIQKHRNDEGMDLREMVSTLSTWDGSQSQLLTDDRPVDKMTAMQDEGDSKERPHIPKLAEDPAKDEESAMESAKRLLDLGVGDAGRIKHIIKMLEDGKRLYSSDKGYLETMIKKYRLS